MSYPTRIADTYAPRYDPLPIKYLGGNEVDDSSKTRRNLMIVSTTVIAMAFLDARLKSTSFIQFEIGASTWKVWLSALIVVLYLLLRFWASPENRDSSIDWLRTHYEHIGASIAAKLFATDVNALREQEKNWLGTLLGSKSETAGGVVDIYDALTIENNASPPWTRSVWRLTEVVLCPSEWGPWNGCVRFAFSQPAQDHKQVTRPHPPLPPTSSEHHYRYWKTSRRLKITVIATVLWKYPPSGWPLLERYAPLLIGFTAATVSIYMIYIALQT